MTERMLVHLQAQKPPSPTPSVIMMQNQSADESDRLAAKMEVDGNHATAHVPILKGRLDEMRRKQQQDMEWLNPCIDKASR